jgi:hypothetical protein
VNLILLLFGWLLAVWPVSSPSVGGAQPAALEAFEPLTRGTFRAWGSHGDYEVSEDGRSVFFSENGPDGLVLRRASLEDGSIKTVEVGLQALHLAVIPGDANHLAISWQPGNGASSPLSVAVLDVNTGRRIDLKVGRDGGDGVLNVSLSGRYLVTGADIRPLERWWEPGAVALFAVKTGRRELTIPIGRGARWEWSAAWGPEDQLVVDHGDLYSAFRRDENGRWVTIAPPSFAFPRRRIMERFYSGQPLRIARPDGSTSLEVAPSALFGPDVPAIITVHPAFDRIVVLRERPETGWKEIEAVTLKWKGHN